MASAFGSSPGTPRWPPATTAQSAGTDRARARKEFGVPPANGRHTSRSPGPSRRTSRLVVALIRRPSGVSRAELLLPEEPLRGLAGHRLGEGVAEHDIARPVLASDGTPQVLPDRALELQVGFDGRGRHDESGHHGKAVIAFRCHDGACGDLLKAHELFLDIGRD